MVVLVVLLSYNVLISPPYNAQITTQVDENSVYSELLDQISQLQSKINSIAGLRETEPAKTEYENEVRVEVPIEKPTLTLAEKARLFDEGKCQINDKIYFLKTSKTGSTSVANILMRFGLRRPGTTFLVGETANGGFFFNNQYMPFNAETCYLGKNVNPRPVFDISYVHMRYNKTAIDYLMHPDHKVILHQVLCSKSLDFDLSLFNCICFLVALLDLTCTFQTLFRVNVNQLNKTSNST